MATMSSAEIAAELRSLTGWQQVDLAGRPAIRRVIKTGSFLDGLGLVTRVAVLAERADHHPDVLLTYPQVTLHLTTHDAGGLTEKDFKLARAIDPLVRD